MKKQIFFFEGINIVFYSEINDLYNKIYKKVLETNLIPIIINKKQDIAVFKFKISESISVKFYPTSNKLVVAGKEENFKSGISLYYILEYFYACLTANRTQSLWFHGAAVYSPKIGKSILIIGDKGSGKTSLVYRLCKTNKMQLIANDIVRVSLSKSGKLYTSTGTQFLTIRETAVYCNSFMREFIKYFSNGKPLWDNKIIVRPNDIGIETNSNLNEIALIINLRLDKKQKECITYEDNGTQIKLLLHEKIGRHISGQATPFMDDFSNYYGNLPLINFRKNSLFKTKFVKALLDKKIYRIYSSNIDEIIEYIFKKIHIEREK